MQSRAVFISIFILSLIPSIGSARDTNLSSYTESRKLDNLFSSVLELVGGMNTPRQLEFNEKFTLEFDHRCSLVKSEAIILEIDDLIVDVFNNTLFPSGKGNEIKELKENVIKPALEDFKDLLGPHIYIKCIKESRGVTKTMKQVSFFSMSSSYRFQYVTGYDAFYNFTYRGNG